MQHGLNKDQQERGAIGGQQQGDVTYGIMPEQVTKQLTDNPGAEFIVIQRTHQSEEPKVWSSGDPEQTQSLFRGAYTALAFDPAKETVTT